MTEAYPLQWPEGWPRTSEDQRERGNQFRQGNGYGTFGRSAISFAVARDKLYGELERLGAKGTVVSSNHKPDKFGIPIESKRKTPDEGIAIYFQLKGKALAMACDRFDNAAANMRSLGLAIEAMRQLERHGGGQMVERAFSGFAALPPPSSGRKWYDVLDVLPTAPLNLIELAYKKAAKRYHPDLANGSAEKMAELNAAVAQARKEKA